MNTNNLNIFSAISGADAVKTVGSVLISAKWKETANQKRMERAVLIPMECVKAPEVPESFRALVESVLLSSAESVLKGYCDGNKLATEVDSSLFDRPNLIQVSIEGAKSDWLGKEELELAFTASATWKRIASKPEFTGNKAYQAAANRFKDTILKLSGKATQLDADLCDVVLSKIEDADLETRFGEFVVSRLQVLKNKKVAELDLSAL